MDAPHAPLPEGFGISDRVRKWAAQKGHSNLETHLESFLGKVKAKGYRYVDWDEAFMTAIRDDWAKLQGRLFQSVQPATSVPTEREAKRWLEERAAITSTPEVRQASIEALRALKRLA